MAKAGGRKIAKYGEFKATAVKLSSLPGVLIQGVAAALDVHPVHAVAVKTLDSTLMLYVIDV